jgi:hypothetical protein
MFPTHFMCSYGRSCWCSRGDNNKKSKKNCATVSTSDLGFSQPCMKNLSWSLVLFPYKMQLSQPLSEDGIARRHAFAREYGALLEQNQDALNVVWFSDDAHFHLDSYAANGDTRTTREMKGFDTKYFNIRRIRPHIVTISGLPTKCLIWFLNVSQNWVK